MLVVGLSVCVCLFCLRGCLFLSPLPRFCDREFYCVVLFVLVVVPVCCGLCFCCFDVLLLRIYIYIGGYLSPPRCLCVRAVVLNVYLSLV